MLCLIQSIALFYFLLYEVLRYVLKLRQFLATFGKECQVKLTNVTLKSLLVRHQVLVDLEIYRLYSLYGNELIEKCLVAVLVIIFVITCLEFEKVAEFCNYAVGVEAQPQRLQLQEIHFIKRIRIRILYLLISWYAWR